MLLFAVILKGAAAVAGILAAALAVVPGSLVVVREYAQTLGYEGRLALQQAWTVERLSPRIKRSLHALFIDHGLPPAQPRYGLERSPDPDLVGLMTLGYALSDSGYSLSDVGCSWGAVFDSEPTPTGPLDEYVRPTMVMVSATPPAAFVWPAETGTVLPPDGVAWPCTTFDCVPTDDPAHETATGAGWSLSVFVVDGGQGTRRPSFDVDVVAHLPLVIALGTLATCAVVMCLVGLRRRSKSVVHSGRGDDVSPTFLQTCNSCEDQQHVYA